jgi:maleylpyruvate isomerase
MPEDAWTAQVRALNGPPFPALGVLERRLSEVEIHHVDMAAGYSPADWPGDFLSEALPRVAESFAGRDDVPSCVARAEGAKDSFRLGPERAGTPAVIINGRPADLLAWLLGRGDGASLTVTGGGAVPQLPPWR